MNKSQKKLVLIIILISPLSYCTGIVGGYHSGTVLDAKTKKPIQDAEVIVSTKASILDPGHAAAVTLNEQKTTTN